MTQSTRQTCTNIIIERAKALGFTHKRESKRKNASDVVITVYQTIGAQTQELIFIAFETSTGHISITENLRRAGDSPIPRTAQLL
jgi:hypothetical protein